VPRHFWQDAEFEKLFDPELEPALLLNERHAKLVDQAVKESTAGIIQARKLVDFPKGRYPEEWNEKDHYPMFTGEQHAREVGNLLRLDVLDRGQRCDIDGALVSCRAVLNGGRSMGDEPYLIVQLIRIAFRGIAVRAVERALAQGEASDRQLLLVQALVEDEIRQPLFLIAARGERAEVSHVFEHIQKGEWKRTAFAQYMGGGRSWSGILPPEGELLVLLSGSLEGQWGAYFRYQSQAVEIAKLPPDQWDAGFNQLQKTEKDLPWTIRLMVPAQSRIAESFRRSLAELSCVRIMLAMERFRLAQGRWPASVAELIPRYLDAIPLDPYNGKPLRCRRVKDGWVIYSVARDGQDDGGNLDFKGAWKPGTDIGVRLYDVARRRQPPPPNPSTWSR
jgi:hypothetical protein